MHTVSICYFENDFSYESMNLSSDCHSAESVDQINGSLCLSLLIFYPIIVSNNATMHSDAIHR